MKAMAMTEEIGSSAATQSLSRKITWFVVLYVGGVVAVAAVALVIRLVVLSATH
jgi:hypothetical protein